MVPDGLVVLEFSMGFEEHDGLLGRSQNTSVMGIPKWTRTAEPDWLISSSLSARWRDHLMGEGF